MLKNQEQDLIVTINIKLSKLYKNIVIETLVGKIRKLKSKQFSGPSSRINIYEYKRFKNLDELQLQKLQRLLEEDFCQQFEKDKYIISEKILEKIFELFVNCGFVFLAAEDRKKYLIEEYSLITKEYYQGLYISNGVEIPYIKSNENNKQIMFIKNKVFFIPCKDNFNGEKKDIEPKQPLGKEKKLGQSQTFKPEAILYVIIEKTRLRGELCFRYNDFEIKYHEINLTKKIQKENILRDKGYENKIKLFLQNENWIFEGGSSFLLKRKDTNISMKLENLMSKGIILLTKSKKNIKVGSVKNAAFSYHVDWFEFEGQYVFDGKEYALADLINKRIQGGFTQLDKNTVIFDETINKIKETKGQVNSEGTLELNKNQYWRIRKLTKVLNIKDINNFENFIDFTNVRLRIPVDLGRILRPYQKEGIKWLKHLYVNGFGGCLADDMGLGKTIQMIGLLSDVDIMSQKKPNLIVMPKTLISNWQNEITQFNPKIQTSIYHGENRHIDRCSDVIITTYGTLYNDIEKIKEIKFNIIIFDEVQNIKNISAKTRGAAKKLIAQNIFALSGTPMENNIGELWAVLDLVNPAMFGTKKEFQKTYIDENTGVIKGIELRQVIAPFILRRVKKDVLFELPPKTEKVVFCRMRNNQAELYAALRINILRELNATGSRFKIKDNSMLLAGLTDLRIACCDPKALSREKNIKGTKDSTKFDKLKELLIHLVESKEKVVVFSQFTKTLKRIEKWIIEKGWKHYYLDGQSTNRGSIVKSFEESEDGIFLISTKAGGVGINLTSACYAIIFDPWWNPAVETQAEDRIHRIGQKRPVTIFRLIVEDTIEEKIEQLKMLKDENVEKVFGDEYKVSELDEKVIKKLLL